MNILFEKTITKKAKVFQQREVSLVSNNLDLLVNNINDYILTLSIDTSLQSVLRKYDDLPEGQEEQYNVKLQLLRAIYARTALNSYIDTVAVISKNGMFFDLDTYAEDILIENIEKTGIEIENLQNKTTWFGPIEIENDYGKSSNIFVVAKPVVDIWSPNTIGYILIIINENKVSSFYNNLAEKNTELYVINEENKIISAANKEFLYKDVEKMEFAKNNKDNYVITSEALSVNNWKVVDIVPKKYLVREMSTINLYLVEVGIIAVLISFFIAYLIASNVTRPVYKMAKAMESYDYVLRGDHVEEVPFPVEMNLLTRRFNQLVDHIHELMKQVAEENEQKREYEFRLMQAQIRPHFLYNSLETIISLIGISMNDQAIQYTKSLGNFYRISLSSGPDIISLSEELDNIKNYLYMQGIRYVDKMEYEIDENPAAGNFSIPKLTLQPIVENAIYHGIKPKRIKCLLKVSNMIEDGDVIISVWDNGVGIPEEKMNALFQSDVSYDRGGFGLKSINDRLKLIFGSHYGITINSKYGEYTEVIVRIPADKRRGGNYVQNSDY
ncbi:MAG: sensor histidine kinase [Oliverpabstia sp.]